MISSGPLTRVAIGLALAATPVGAMTAANACIALTRLKKTTAIDNETIIATLKGRGQYRRISLASACGGLKFHNACSFETSENWLCRGASITVMKVGTICSVAAIDELAADEAKSLLGRPATTGATKH